MQDSLYQRFAPVIRALTPTELQDGPSITAKLTLAVEGPLQMCYAPFDYTNRHARVVLVGITPGRSQMLAAVREARRQMDLGAPGDLVLREAKRAAAFGGPMRANLTATLDFLGVAQRLGASSAADLFGKSAELIQTTSVLRNPVLVDGRNYNGTPDPWRSPMLAQQIRQGFLQELEAMPSARIIALGAKVAAIIERLVRETLIDRDRVLGMIPHPSPENGERIKYFLGKKQKERLSNRVDPGSLDLARASIQERVAALQ